MPKVLFVSNTANFSKFNRSFMRWFREQGWQVDYASPCEEEIYDCDNSFCINISRNPFSFVNYKGIINLRILLKNGKYSIIHCHTPMGAVIARLAARRFRKKGLKVIYTAHGFHFYKGAPLKNWILYYPIEKYLSKFTDILVTINEEDYQIAQAKFYTKNIQKINGVGVNLSKFKPIGHIQRVELRKENNYADTDFILLYVAELIPRKNHKLLLAILPILHKQIPELKIIFCGKGRLLESYKEEVKGTDCEKIINFTGYRNDINKICAFSDLHVSPSKQEGLSINNIEAMATGLPIIASKIRGHVDEIKNERNGLLFDLNDKQQLLDAIIRLYNNEAERKKYSENNLQDVKKFSNDIAVEKMAKIYQTIM